MDNSTILLIIFLVLTFLFTKKQSQSRQIDQATLIKGVKYQEETEITTKNDNKNKVEKKESNEEEEKLNEEEEKEAKLQEQLHKPVIQVKRKVTIDMIEIVQTLAPTLDVKQIEYSLNQTGSIEDTVNDFLSGKMDSFPSTDESTEKDETEKKPVASTDEEKSEDK